MQEDANTAGFTMIESAVHNGIPKKGSTGSNRTPRWSPWGDSGGLVREYATRCKTVVQRLVDEVKNRNNPAAAEELFSPDYVHHFNFPGVELPPGLAGSATVGGIFGTAFPEIEVTLEILIADGEFVLERSSVVALHAGEFLGTLATNQTVTWTENHLYRIVDGRIVEHWPEVDIAGLLETDGGISCPLSGSLWTFGRMLKAAQVMGGSLTSCRWSGREDLNLRSPRPERDRTCSLSPFSRIAVPHGAHISAAHRIIGSEEGRRIRSIRRLRVPGPNPGSSGGGGGFQFPSWSVTTAPRSNSSPRHPDPRTRRSVRRR